MYCHKITQYKTYSSVVTFLLSNKIKGNNHEQQSNKPHTYQKGVPTCRGIKRCRRKGGDTLPQPLSLPRGTQGMKKHPVDVSIAQRRTK